MPKGWHRNTNLGCDLKTVLRSDNTMKTGKEYLGMLRRDTDTFVDDFIGRDAHFTFVEAETWTTKRNPRVFNGKYISVTRRDDGTLRPNFKPLPTTDDFNVASYAVAVGNELMWALEGLVEK